MPKVAQAVGARISNAISLLQAGARDQLYQRWPGCRRRASQRYGPTTEVPGNYRHHRTFAGRRLSA
jgi:hypothetical protein